MKEDGLTVGLQLQFAVIVQQANALDTQRFFHLLLDLLQMLQACRYVRL